MADYISNYTGEEIDAGITSIAGKQEKLVSGENIKTINHQSILGEGNINISGTGAVDSVNGKIGEVVLEADDIPAEGSQTVQENLDYLHGVMSFSTEEKTVIGSNVHISDNHSSEIDSLKIYGSENGVRTINIGKNTETATKSIELDDIAETIEDTASGTNIILENLNSPTLKNLKIYGKLEFDPEPWKLENVEWAGTPGWVNDQGIFTNLISTSEKQEFFMTMMKVPVIGGDTYIIDKLPRLDGGTAAIHWFTKDYGFNPTIGASQPGWITRDKFTDNGSHILTAPANAAYLEIQGSILNTDIPITTDKVKAAFETSGFSLIHEATGVNIFDIDEFTLGEGNPIYGFISAEGIYTIVNPSGTPYDHFGITSMKIPVEGGKTYTARHIPEPAGVAGIHWFDSSYTGVDRTNTTTKQTGWISRNVQTGITPGKDVVITAVAPANAAYAEIQFGNNDNIITEQYAKQLFIDKEFAFIDDEAGPSEEGDFGVINISDNQEGGLIQTIDLTSIESESNDSYISKDNNIWKVFNGGITIELPSEIQSQLNSLSLYNGDNKIWNDNNQNVEVQYSAQVSISFDDLTAENYIAKENDVWVVRRGSLSAPLSEDNAEELDALEFLGHNTYFWTNSNSNMEIAYVRDYMVTPAAKRSIKILLLTNSFGQDSFSYVPYLFNRLVGNEVDIKIGMLYHGGQTLQGHWNAINGNLSDWTYYETTNENSWVSKGSQKAITELLSDDWDMFIMNQLSTKTVDESSFSPYLGNIINWVYTNTTHPIKLGMFFGGTYPSSSPQLTIDTMYEQSVPVLQNILDEYPIEIFIPAGTAIQNARTNATLDALGNTGHLLYDNLHAQEGIPVLMEAYTVVLGLLKAMGLENHSIIGDKPPITDAWVTAMAIPGKHGSVAGMTDNNILLAQKCAIMAHKKPFEVTNIE